MLIHLKCLEIKSAFGLPASNEAAEVETPKKAAHLSKKGDVFFMFYR